MDNKGDLKLFSVKVSIDIYMPVVATNAEHANSVARRNVYEEIDNIDTSKAKYEPEELDALPLDFEKGLAYWDLKFSGDSRTEWPCERWLTEEGSNGE